MNKTDIQALFASFSEHLQPMAQALCDVVLGGDGVRLVQVLSTYQNKDGGFGHGLEADIQMPMSSVAATDLAMDLLEDVRHPSKNEPIKRAIRYYESVYDPRMLSVPIVPREVDEYPHAVWWNHDGLDAFTYANPNAEVCGTLLQHRQLVRTVDVDAFSDMVVSYIENEMSESLSMHSLLSCARLYRRAPKNLQDRLLPTLLDYVDRELVTEVASWGEYGLEPYKLARIEPSLLARHPNLLQQNLAHLSKRLEQGPIDPAWQWYQYDDVFEQVKEHWVVLLTYEALMVVRANSM
jgi:hypothetical protein